MYLHTCCANSLVGAKTNACISGTFSSMRCKTDTEKVAVFPVPDCACAITSLPAKAKKMSTFKKWISSNKKQIIKNDGWEEDELIFYVCCVINI